MTYKAILALCVAVSLPVGAMASAYFPLQVRNQWVYEHSGSTPGGPIVVHVLESEVIGKEEYFLASGLTPSAAWLRLSGDGVFLGHDRESGSEATWADFSKGVGETYATAMHGCSPAARVDSLPARVEVPAGVFEDALVSGYPAPSCADAGLQSDYYAPGIGLVQRTVTTFAGPQAMNLIYARVGDRTVVSRPEVFFGLSLDRAIYSGRLNLPLLTARIMLGVRQEEPLELSFPSSQRFELILKNAQRQEVYRWSDGRVFTLMYGAERFGPGEKIWLEEVKLQMRDGSDFPPGKYTAECWLTNAGERRYAATAGFEIAAWREPAAGLSGGWVFEAKTNDGSLRASLNLQLSGMRLSASLRIDNHLLSGEGETDGTQFDVLLTHADGSGPGHSERLRLKGRLEDGLIMGSFDNGADQGNWKGVRVQ